MSARRLLLALSTCLAFTLQQPACASSLTLLGVGVSDDSGGGSGYSGPGDVAGSAASHWYGVRAYNGTYAAAGSTALQLCTASDAACTDIHVTSTGDLNSSDITTSGCSAIDTCTVKNLYDQTGGALTLTQATEANRPTFKRSAVGGKPCLAFTSSPRQYMTSAASVTQTQPMSFSTVAETTSTATNMTPFGKAAGGLGIVLFPSVSKVGGYAGSNLQSAASYPINSFYTTEFIANGASSSVYANGTNATGSSGSNAFSSEGLQIGGSTATPLTGYVCEGGLWSGSFSSSAVDSNQRSYYGF